MFVKEPTERNAECASGMQDLTKVHIFNRGRSSYMMEHNLQGLAYLLAAGWQSDENLKRLFTGVATMVPGGGGGGGGGHGPSLLSYFSAVSMSLFTFAIASILCCGPLTCLLLATPLWWLACGAPVSESDILEI